MTNLTTWVNETPERRRSYEQERLIVDVAEAVQGLLDKAGMKRAELGRRTGIARQSLHQMLSGQQNLTLRTMATIAHELGYRVSVSFEPYSTLETPADLVGALQDKVHADSGPFRAGRSVMAKVRQNYAQRCTCKDYPGADEFCTAHDFGKLPPDTF